MNPIAIELIRCACFLLDTKAEGAALAALRMTTLAFQFDHKIASAPETIRVCSGLSHIALNHSPESRAVVAEIRAISAAGRAYMQATRERAIATLYKHNPLFLEFQQ